MFTITADKARKQAEEPIKDSHLVSHSNKLTEEILIEINNASQYGMYGIDKTIRIIDDDIHYDSEQQQWVAKKVATTLKDLGFMPNKIIYCGKESCNSLWNRVFLESDTFSYIYSVDISWEG